VEVELVVPEPVDNRVTVVAEDDAEDEDWTVVLEERVELVDFEVVVDTGVLVD